MLKKDKKKVIGEDMTDAQIDRFVQYQPTSAQDSSDFLCLQAAYRGLRLHDFERFLSGFSARGGQFDAKDRHGKTLMDYMKDHAKSADYLAAIHSAQD